MNQANRRYRVLILVIGTLMVASSVFFLVEAGTRQQAWATKGSLDLYGWNQAPTSVITLGGEWLFQTPTGDLQPRVVPHFWESDPTLGAQPYGHGKYELGITGLTPGAIYGLGLPDQAAAYRLWINGNEVASNGVPGLGAETTVHRWHPGLGLLVADAQGRAHLVMEISNFAYYRGGFWNALALGTVDQIWGEANKRRGLDWVLSTMILTVAILLIGLFIIRPKEKTTLYFAFFCFLMATRTLLEGERLVMDILPSFPWELLVRAEFLLGYLLLPFFALFALELFAPPRGARILKRGFEGLLILTIVGTLVLPHPIYALYLEPNKWGCVAFGVYLLVLVGASMRAKRPGAELMLFACLGMIAALLQEIFVRGPDTWVTFAALNFVLCFATIVMERLFRVVKENEVLERRVIHDPLTGAYNRAFLADLDQRIPAQEGPFWVLFLDLDHFKPINDTHGHRVGDLILQEVARRLKAMVRDSDVVCRYGGDEFVIVLFQAKAPEVAAIADRILKAVQRPIEAEGLVHQVGASLGIIEGSAQGPSMEALVKKSDQAMYRAKESGGNRYVWDQAR